VNCFQLKSEPVKRLSHSDQNLKSELQAWYMMNQKGFIVTQIHKKFTIDQVKVLFTAYEAGHISRSEIMSTLGIGKTRFFALLKQFRAHSDSFSIEYQRKVIRA